MAGFHHDGTNHDHQAVRLHELHDRTQPAGHESTQSEVDSRTDWVIRVSRDGRSDALASFFQCRDGRGRFGARRLPHALQPCERRLECAGSADQAFGAAALLVVEARREVAVTLLIGGLADDVEVPGLEPPRESPVGIGRDIVAGGERRYHDTSIQPDSILPCGVRAVPRLDEPEMLECVAVATVARVDASEALGGLAVIAQVVLAAGGLQLQVVDQYALAARRLFELAEVEHRPVHVEELDSAALCVDRPRQRQNHSPRNTAELLEREVQNFFDGMVLGHVEVQHLPDWQTVHADDTDTASGLAAVHVPNPPALELERSPSCRS